MSEAKNKYQRGIEKLSGDLKKETPDTSKMSRSEMREQYVSLTLEKAKKDDAKKKRDAAKKKKEAETQSA